MGCAKKVVGISGVGKGSDIAKALMRAIGHLMIQGSQGCAGPCGDQAHPGICKFGLTKLNQDIQVAKDADGKGVMVTVTGDGECFCG